MPLCNTDGITHQDDVWCVGCRLVHCGALWNFMCISWYFLMKLSGCSISSLIIERAAFNTRGVSRAVYLAQSGTTRPATHPSQYDARVEVFLLFRCTELHVLHVAEMTRVRILKRGDKKIHTTNPRRRNYCQGTWPREHEHTKLLTLA